MSQAAPIEPDISFIRELKTSGGDDLKKCFQCATCSVVCNLSPAERPFPRKEMVWAQWGLKDRLASDPDVWLCHQCNDCSKYCPRGARPGDVMAALRRRQIEDNAAPRFLARMVSDPRFLPVIFAFPVMLLLLFMSAAGTLHIPRRRDHLPQVYPPMARNRRPFSADCGLGRPIRSLYAAPSLGRLWRLLRRPIGKPLLTSRHSSRRWPSSLISISKNA